jgi:hypothetical protein
MIFLMDSPDVSVRWWAIKLVEGTAITRSVKSGRAMASSLPFTLAEKGVMVGEYVSWGMRPVQPSLYPDQFLIFKKKPA